MSLHFLLRCDLFLPRCDLFSRITIYSPAASRYSSCSLLTGDDHAG